ncbi:GNAT family N-acetyltransferase [Marinifilum flexuosum]|uniref:N-acetylglutamate synthase-like GNAT family acetyltransferase n=1 Tax=Marinifilum flexuosum TaxID=1117708 RepID=A0A419WFC6_9BACT|nr:GNAT family N-acetyltransferase [Marinifilum flexuosum]RKD94056.1 N-acetylglutamate synthase-like GNAT family acetyltransferase [Marinifilum flexuosum]
MIRKYSNTDKSKLIQLLRQNIPEYFATSEELDFKEYLENEIEDYFIYEEDSEIIGAGGINYFPDEKIARISWDMIDPKHQGKGIGKKLTQHRINHLNDNLNVELIIVRTSQLVYKFYEKMGFELEKIEKDFWAKGFDLYQMKMDNNTKVRRS